MRSVLKTVSYASMHLSVAIAVAFVLTGDWAIALGVGIVEPMVQTFAYALHEKLWAGRKTDSSDGPAASPAHGLA